MLVADRVRHVAAGVGGDELEGVSLGVGEAVLQQREEIVDLRTPERRLPRPEDVTGSLRDQMSLRGVASPLWSAVSASIS